MAASEDLIHWLETARWKVQRLEGWKYQWHGNVLVRYVEHAPLEWMEDAIAYLNTDRCCSSLYIDEKPLGMNWRPLRAWYDEEGGGQRDSRTVRLYQAVRSVEDVSADGPYRIESGCKYLVDFTFYWRAAALPSVPPSVSGVSYSLESCRRDGETGLFSCVAVCRRRVEQTVARYESHLDTFTTVSSGKKLGVVEGHEGASVAALAMKSVSGDGFVVDVAMDKNDDCTKDITVRNLEERAVADASVLREVELTGVRTTVKSRSQVVAPVDLTEVGSAVRCERTEGGRFDVTVVRWALSGVARLRELWGKTLFSHRHEVVSVVKVGSELAEPVAVKLGDGVLYQRQNKKLENGLIEATEVVESAQGVEEVSVQAEVELTGVRTTVTHRNRKVAQALPTAVGETVRNEKTEGGLFNVTMVRWARNALSKVLESWGKTLYVHRHDVVSVVASGSELKEPVAVRLGDGVLYQRKNRRLENGLIEVTEGVESTQVVDEAARSLEFQAMESRGSREDRGVRSAPILPTAQRVGSITRTEVQKSDSGVYSVATYTRDAVARSFYATFRTVKGRTVSTYWFRNFSETQMHSMAQSHQGGSVSMNEFGLYDGTLQDVEVDEDSRGGLIRYPTYEVTFPRVKRRYVGKVEGYSVPQELVTTYTIVKGILNDNAAAVAAKLKLSKGESEMRWLGNSSSVQGQGYYSYEYVSAVVSVLSNAS